MVATRLFHCFLLLTLVACLAPDVLAYQDSGDPPRYHLTERQVARMGLGSYWKHAATKLNRRSNDLALPHVNGIEQDYATCRNHENQRLLRTISPRYRRHACQIHTSLMDLAETWADCDLAETAAGQVKGAEMAQAEAEIADLSAQIAEGMRKNSRKRYALFPLSSAASTLRMPSAEKPCADRSPSGLMIDAICGELACSNRLAI